MAALPIHRKIVLKMTTKWWWWMVLKCVFVSVLQISRPTSMMHANIPIAVWSTNHTIWIVRCAVAVRWTLGPQIAAEPIHEANEANFQLVLLDFLIKAIDLFRESGIKSGFFFRYFLLCGWKHGKYELKSFSNLQNIALPLLPMAKIDKTAKHFSKGRKYSRRKSPTFLYDRAKVKRVYWKISTW